MHLDSWSKRNGTFNLSRIRWIHYYFFVLIITSLLIRLYLSSNLKGALGDQIWFINWMNTVGKYGLWNVYQYGLTVNYPPLFLSFLGIYKELLSALHLQAEPGDILIRLPSILFDMAAIFIIIAASKNVSNLFMRAIIVAILALSPAVLYDGAVWGQIDMLYSLLMVCAILLLGGKPLYSGIFYSLALLTKFQSIMIAPIFLVFFIRHIWEKRESIMLFKYMLGFFIPIVIFGGYFAAHGTFFVMLKHAYLSAVGTFPNVSVQAMNIWYYAIGTTPDMLDTTIILPHLSLKRVGLLLLFISVVCTCIYILFNRKNNTAVLLRAATFLSFSFFMLPTEIHERYSFPALVFVVFLLIFDFKWMGIAIGLSITIFLNLLMLSLVNPYMGIFIVIFNCIIYYTMFKLLISDYIGQDHYLFTQKSI